jgi:spore coat protein U-like protein
MRIFFLFFFLLPYQALAFCSVSLPNIQFGDYAPLYDRQDYLSSGQISVSCSAQSNTPSYQLKISTGRSNTFKARFMTSSFDEQPLFYNIYLDSYRQAVWGDGTGGSSYYSGQLSPSTTIPIYFKIFSNQNPAPGLYKDQIFLEMAF